MKKTESTQTEAFYAWGIDTRSEEGHGFIGRYWGFGNTSPIYPVHMAGCQLALFRTRALARKHLPEVTTAFPRAQVAEVRVTVERV